jgi:glycosyltransferase involved in cell wall biosynthesis
LRRDTEEVFDVGKPVEVIHNFYTPGQPTSTREKMREDLKLGDSFTLFHASNLRSVKRIDLLLESVARCKSRSRLKLVIMAGNSFEEFEPKVKSLGLEDTVIVRQNGYPVEDYIEASDLGIYTSETESFCLSILEAMFLGKASIAFRVGGIPEVMEEGRSGLLCGFGDCDAMAAQIDALMENPARSHELGEAARVRARSRFTAQRIVPQYLACYERALLL